MKVKTTTFLLKEALIKVVNSNPTFVQIDTIDTDWLEIKYNVNGKVKTDLVPADVIESDPAPRHFDRYKSIYEKLRALTDIQITLEVKSLKTEIIIKPNN